LGTIHIVRRGGSEEKRGLQRGWGRGATQKKMKDFWVTVFARFENSKR